MQKATGHQDSVEAMADYLIASTKDPDREKIHAYCEGSVELFDWLESLGFEFERSFYPEKAVIQPGKQGLMFTGNEKVWPYRENIKPAPRGHKVPVPGDTEGTKIVMDLLRTKAEEAGVTPIEYTDKIVGMFQQLWKELNISNDDFIRTTITGIRAVHDPACPTGAGTAGAAIAGRANLDGCIPAYCLGPRQLHGGYQLTRLTTQTTVIDHARDAGHRKRGQNTDDNHHDHQLHQGKPPGGLGASL